MRVWLYARLSRDDDEEMNSLSNQRKIVREYAEKNGYEIVGESYDDNISGMRFDRAGLSEISEAAEAGEIDMVIVKDLSRLGRHRTQTAMYIDFLMEHSVSVQSVTENINTFNDSDDLLIGFMSLVNDQYAKDTSKKIHSGYIQSQKEGLVILPPLGYFKDKNTNEVVIVEEQAEIVRRIYSMYLDGYGFKTIAAILNNEGVGTPAYYQQMTIKKKIGRGKPEIAYRHLWNNTTVKRILTNEFYSGTLICHKTYTNKIKHVRKSVPTEEQFRHENAVPAIISREIWEQVQLLISSRKKQNVRASEGKPAHRYTGLIKCGDCGSTFVCRERKWRDKPVRYEYICNGYHRYGKNNCTAHRIGEATLDELIYDELHRLRKFAHEYFKDIDEKLKRWLADRPSAKRRVDAMAKDLAQRKRDQQSILLERIRDPEHAGIYSDMLKACEADIARLTKAIEEFNDLDTTIKSRKKKIQKSIDILDEALKDGAVSDAHLRILIDQIKIYERNKKLRVVIELNGEFRIRMDSYDQYGGVTDHAEEMWYYGENDESDWGEEAFETMPVEIPLG